MIKLNSLYNYFKTDRFQGDRSLNLIDPVTHSSINKVVAYCVSFCAPCCCDDSPEQVEGFVFQHQAAVPAQVEFLQRGRDRIRQQDLGELVTAHVHQLHTHTHTRAHNNTCMSNIILILAFITYILITSIIIYCFVKDLMPTQC